MMAESTLFVFRSVLRICSYFNPRTPVGCDASWKPSFMIASLFQSTHPSGVRLENPELDEKTDGISIHAPQWGATPLVCHRWGHRRISIHAPQWGATPKWHSHSENKSFQSTHPSGVRRAHRRSTVRTPPYFNPRTPVGCDLKQKPPPYGMALFQSTHPSGVRPASQRC